MSRPLTWAGTLAGAALIAMLWAGPSAARDLAVIRSDGVLKVAMTGDYPPFSLRGADGQLAGADVTMAKDLARALGVALVIVRTTWKSLQADMEADRYDIAMGGVSITPDRTRLGDFSMPVMRDGKRPIVRCSDKDRYTSIAAIDRPAVRVVVNPGGTNERFARANFAKAKIEVHPDNRTIVDEIAADPAAADVMVTDGAEVDYQSALHPGILCPATVSQPFDRSDKAYWMTGDPALREAVNAWLTPILQSGEYRRLVGAPAVMPRMSSGSVGQ